MTSMYKGNIEEMAPIIRGVAGPVPIARQSVEEVFWITAA